jgi:predicted lipoprotein with Yx(FWY)xxD motif
LHRNAIKGDDLNVKYRLASAVAVLGVLGVTATALAVIPATAQVKTRKTSSLGTILVDGKSKTLYLFMRDKSGKSSCYGSCAANWPPYLTLKKPKAGPGAKASLLGTTKRTDGKLQVTYNHHPLYWFKFDTKAGQTRGEKIHAFGADWFVVSPKGVKVEPKGPTGPTGPAGNPPPPPPPPPPPYP